MAARAWITTRHQHNCNQCSAVVPAGERAEWDYDDGSIVACLRCATPPPTTENVAESIVHMATEQAAGATVPMPVPKPEAPTPMPAFPTVMKQLISAVDDLLRISGNRATRENSDRIIAAIMRAVSE